MVWIIILKTILISLAKRNRDRIQERISYSIFNSDSASNNNSRSNSSSTSKSISTSNNSLTSNSDPTSNNDLRLNRNSTPKLQSLKQRSY